MRILISRFVSPLVLFATTACFGQNLGQTYQDPPGGWSYAYGGGAAAFGSGTGFDALDGFWSHSNGSDAWDGSGIGGTLGDANRPGGLSVLTAGEVTFLRMQDTGDPRDHGFPGDSPFNSNRKLYFAYDLATAALPATFLDDGVTLAFRARIATTGPLDGQYPDTDSGNNKGENRFTAGGTEWQAAGNGYLNANGGKGNFTLRQQSGDKQISFSLAMATDLFNDETPVGVTGLAMNSLVGTSTTGAVDTWAKQGVLNILSMASLTDDFHDFWITIRADTSGGGTHRVEVYVDGHLTPQVFHVTAGDGNDTQYDSYSFLAMGMGNTQQQGAMDVDYVAVTSGLHTPAIAQGVAAVGFAEHPVSVAVNEGETATFSLLATGGPPRLVQWQRDDGAGSFTNVPGAIYNSLAVGPVTSADDGALFRGVVSNSLGVVTSSEAFLAVLSDSTPPTVIAVSGRPLPTQVVIRFSEALLPESANEVSHYAADNGLEILSASLDPSGTNVLLTTSSQTPGTVYTITLNQIRDASSSANSIAPNTPAVFTAWVLSRGFLAVERYLDLPGTTIADLTMSPKYPHWPELLGYVNAGEAAQSNPDLDDYGGRLSGWVVPPVSGDYIFYVRGDDATELRLSFDADPENVTALAVGLGAGQPFVGSPIQSLTAGQRYYLEVLWKEGPGDDYVQVGWQRPGLSEIETIPCSALEAYADPTGASVSITSHPADQTVSQNRSAVLSVAADLTPLDAPQCYFWERDNGAGVFTNLFASNTDSLTTPRLRYPEDDGAAYRVVVAVPGASATSEVATVTVVEDTNGPVLVRAERVTCVPNALIAHFSELVDFSVATNANNYFVTVLNTDSVLAVLPDSVTPGPDGQSVRMVVEEPLLNGNIYQLYAFDVPDLAQNAAESIMTVTLAGDFAPVGPTRLVVIEAENAGMTPRPWEGVDRYWEFTDVRLGYSGTGSMQALPNTEGNRPSGNESTSLDFCVNFPAGDTYPRTYYFWVRGSAQGGADNSCHGGLDGVVPPELQNLTQGFDQPPGGFAWCHTNNNNVRAILSIPSAGPHQVQVFMREDGFYCDKILLTTDPDYRPAMVNAGLGPDQTPREYAGPAFPEFMPGTPQLVAGQFMAEIQTITGAQYVIEYKDSFDASEWTELTRIDGNNLAQPVVDPGPLPGARFYRILLLVP